MITSIELRDYFYKNAHATGNTEQCEFEIEFNIESEEFKEFKKLIVDNCFSPYKIKLGLNNRIEAFISSVTKINESTVKYVFVFEVFNYDATWPFKNLNLVTKTKYSEVMIRQPMLKRILTLGTTPKYTPIQIHSNISYFVNSK